mgnify:CR=1 FL=1
MLIFAPALALGAYLIGSIPSGYLVGRIKGVDLRKVGSGNIGATNALRVLGRNGAILSSLRIFLRAGSPSESALRQPATFHPTMPSSRASLQQVFAMVGHIFPVWLGFKGGKGIATSGGIMIGLFPGWVFLCGLVVWVVCLLRHALCFRGIDCGGYLAARFQRHSNALWTLRLASCDHRRPNVRTRRLAAQIKHRTPFSPGQRKIREKALHLNGLSGS